MPGSAVARLEDTTLTYHTGNQLVDPHVLFDKVKLQPNMHVADFGVGRTGHLVFPAAKYIGERGVVYAVDIMKDVLTVIHRRAAQEGFINVHTVWADIERPHSFAIPPRSLDVIFLVNTLFQCRQYEPILTQSKELLKDKGRILVVDWVRRLGTLGPREDSMVDFARLLRAARSLGLAVQEDGPLGHCHRCIVFYKHD